MSQLIDRYLLYRIKVKRDPDAFAKIYDQYVTGIYRFVFLKLPGQEDAQDVTAETFTRFWQYCQQQNVANVRALLYQIARNLVADYYRDHETQTQKASVTLSDDFPSTNIEDVRNGPSVIEARTELALVQRQLGKLKDDFRDVLTLRLVDGLSFSDIAIVLGKTSGHVRVIYHRGIKTLKDMGMT